MARRRTALRPVLCAVLLAAGLGAGCATGGIALGVASESFCAQLFDLVSLTAGAGDPEQSTVLANGVEALEELVDAAPADIRDDIEALYSQARLIAETLQGLDPGDVASLDDLSDLLSEVDLGAVREASVRVAQYVDEHCGD